MSNHTWPDPTSIFAQLSPAGVGWFPLENPGLMRVEGRDRIDFLHRQSTNDLKALAPGQVMTTLLTSPEGRMLDALTLFEDGDALLALTLPGRASETVARLRAHIFFMDKVSIADESADWGQIDLIGPRVSDMVIALGASQAPEPGQVVPLAMGDAWAWALAPERPLGERVRLLFPASAQEELFSRLQALNASLLRPETFELWRIAGGIPGDRELSEQYTPPEIGLLALISMTKGCYTGQEIIARQINYEKVARRLVRLQLDAPVAVGATVSGEGGRKAGEITSAAPMPDGRGLALAILRKPHFLPQTKVTVDGVNGVVMNCQSLIVNC